MKTENEINDDLQQLLDALEEHGQNARRQRQLGDLIDQLAAEENTVALPGKRRKLAPLWWAMGAAAACLLLWFALKPAGTQSVGEEERPFAEQRLPKDTVPAETMPLALPQTPVAQEPVAETKPAEPKKPINNKVQKPKERPRAETVEETFWAEVQKSEQADSEEITKETPTTETPNEPLVVQPQATKRRVIQSTNLVCYGKPSPNPSQPEPKRTLENKTLFGQPQDPNMKNGTLAMEIKF